MNSARPALVFRRARAYFAPVDRAASAPTIFDPAKLASFPAEAPPPPWLDGGWIENFRRLSEGRVSGLRAGHKGALAGQFRAQLDSRVEFDFRSWGKLQMALSGGSQQMNVLAAEVNAEARPSGGTALPPAAVLPGSSAQQIELGLGAVDAFAAGDLIAVDVDYLQQTGYVGSGIAAACVADPADVRYDADYVRRVTFNVGRVAQKTATALVLRQPLPGGAPLSGAAAQKVIAFADREGGSFFQEWSGLFVFDDESGGRAFLYYPRLRPAAPAGEAGWDLEPPLRGLALHAALAAFPHTDVNDGEQVACYRSFVPAPAAAVY